MSKKYISLQDLYLKESAGKTVPQLPCLKVLGEQSPEKQYDVLIQDPLVKGKGGEPMFVGKADQRDLTKIKNLISKEDTNKVLDKLIEINNLSELGPSIKSIFNDYEIDYNVVQKILIDNKNNLPLQNVLTGDYQVINLKKLIMPVFVGYKDRPGSGILAGMDNQPQIFEEFYYRVFDLQIVGGSNVVSVGKGEALLALFTDATKTKVQKAKGEQEAVKGDITFANGTIEVKVQRKGAGRIASQRGKGFDVMNTSIIDILTKRKNGQNITIEDLNNCYSKTDKMEIKVTPEDVNVILPFINQEASETKIESLIVAPVLTAYARKGFTYIMLISPDGIKSGDADCFRAQNFNVILDAVNKNKIFMGVDKDGIKVSNVPIRETGRRIAKTPSSKLAGKKQNKVVSQAGNVQPSEEPKTREVLQSQERPFKGEEPILLPPSK